MRQVPSRCILLFSGLILFLSFFIFLINDFVYQFPGNNFFPEHVPAIALLLIFFNMGLALCFPQHSKFCLIGRELFYFFCVMCLIAFATNAIQLTPFPPIDPLIVTWEMKIHLNMNTIVGWTNSHPEFKQLLRLIYDYLTYQMSLIPLLIIFTCRVHLLREYYFLLLSTLLIGFGFYYFFPTTAPASIMDSSLFSWDQIATGLKFQQIHEHIQPTTNEGGLIALPSFHAIWAILCVNLLKEWKFLCFLLSLINLLLISSCVLLGWHYLTDILGSIVVLLISYYLMNKCSRFYVANKVNYFVRNEDNPHSL
jgi:hypothetical protein